MKFSIITPCSDRATFLDDTIESVLTQQGDFEIEYIIQFSGGYPDVEEVLEKWETFFSSGVFKPKCNNIKFIVSRESDLNMYDGLNKGFAKATGEIYAWINSDDLYHPGAFETVSRIIKENETIHWLSGIPNSFNSVGSRTGYDKIPKAYSREFIKNGYYRIENLQYGLNWIPQDSCFWTSVLWRNAGSCLDSRLKLTADFELWQRFAKYADLVKVESFLGGYRYHGDQFTSDPKEYIKELPSHKELPYDYKRLIFVLNRFPRFRRLIFNKKQGKPWIQMFRVSWSNMIGRTVEWSFDNNSWNVYHHPVI